MKPIKVCPKCGKGFIVYKTVYPGWRASKQAGVTRFYYHSTGFKAKACVVPLTAEVQLEP